MIEIAKVTKLGFKELVSKLMHDSAARGAEPQRVMGNAYKALVGTPRQQGRPCDCGEDLCGMRRCRANNNLTNRGCCAYNHYNNLFPEYCEDCEEQCGVLRALQEVVR